MAEQFTAGDKQGTPDGYGLVLRRDTCKRSRAATSAESGFEEMDGWAARDRNAISSERKNSSSGMEGQAFIVNSRPAVRFSSECFAVSTQISSCREFFRDSFCYAELRFYGFFITCFSTCGYMAT
jgi:hypothetical protein